MGEGMQLISRVTLPEALPNNQINIYYIKNLVLVKANNDSFTKTCDPPSVTTSCHENVLCTYALQIP